MATIGAEIIASTDENLCIEWGVAERPHPLEHVSGDTYFVTASPTGALVAAIDGIGHGADAEIAAQLAADCISKNATEPLPSIIRKCHEGMRGSRGAVISLAHINALQDTVTWIGVGNVDGVIISSQRDARTPTGSLPLRGGVVGGRLPTLQTSGVKLVPGDLIVFATDGVGSSYSDSVSSAGNPQQIAERILDQHAKDNDDALVLVIRYLGGSGA